MAKNTRKQVNTDMPAQQIQQGGINPQTLKPRRKETQVDTGEAVVNQLGKIFPAAMQGMASEFEKQKLKQQHDNDVVARETTALKAKNDLVQTTDASNFSAMQHKLLQQKIKQNPEMSDEEYNASVIGIRDSTMEMTAGGDIWMAKNVSAINDVNAQNSAIMQNQNIFNKGQKEHTRVHSESHSVVLMNVAPGDSIEDVRNAMIDIRRSTTDETGKPYLLDDNAIKAMSNSFLLAAENDNLTGIEVSKEVNVQGYALQEGEQSMYDANPNLRKSEKSAQTRIRNQQTDYEASQREIERSKLEGHSYADKDEWYEAAGAQEVEGQKIWTVVQMESEWKRYERESTQKTKEVTLNDNIADLNRVATEKVLNIENQAGSNYARQKVYDQKTVDGAISLYASSLANDYHKELQAAGQDDRLKKLAIAKNNQKLATYISKNEFKSTNFVNAGLILENANAPDLEAKEIAVDVAYSIDLMNNVQGMGYSLEKNFSTKAQARAFMFNEYKGQRFTDAQALAASINIANQPKRIYSKEEQSDHMSAATAIATSHFESNIWLTDAKIPGAQAMMDVSSNIIADDMMKLAVQLDKEINDMPKSIALASESTLSKYQMLPNSGKVFRMADHKMVMGMNGQGTGFNKERAHDALEVFPDILNAGGEDADAKYLLPNSSANTADWFPKRTEAGDVYWVDSGGVHMTKYIPLSIIGGSYRDWRKLQPDRDAKIRKERLDGMADTKFNRY